MNSVMFWVVLGILIGILLILSLANKLYPPGNEYVDVYMDGIDWQHEIGCVKDYSRVYSSVEDLVRQNPCAEDCGIVQVRVELVKWVRPQKHVKDWRRDV